MKLFKHRTICFLLSFVVFSLLLFQFVSCSKEDPINNDVVCELRGTFTGSGTSHLGNSSYSSYTFQDNNFVDGKEAAGEPYVTFGGYRNTCDSVIMSVYYTTNSSFYILKGKFSNNRNTISGTFNNLTTPTDYGTFTISK